MEPGEAGNILEPLSTLWSQASFLYAVSYVSLPFSDNRANIPCDIHNAINWKHVPSLPLELVNLNVETE